MNSFRFVLILWCTAGLAFSIGTAGGCAKGSDTLVTTDEGCDEEAAAVCKKISDCAPFILQSAYGDEQTCEEGQKQGCLAVLQATGTSRNASDQANCATALRAQSCDDYKAGTPVAACAGRPGSLGGGKACIDGAQCASAFCRVVSSSAGACGICANDPPVELGGTCDVSKLCDLGLVCSGGANATCVAAGTSGSSCDTDHPCAPENTCVQTIGDGGFASGQCIPFGAQGTNCDPTSAPCDPSQGLTCDPTSMQCTTVTLAPAGQTCDGTLTQCTGGACFASPDAGSHSCVSSVLAGSACDVVNGPGCIPPALCTSHVCTIKEASSCL